MKGASTIPMLKGMTDVIVAYGMNGEPLRPQNGFPVRLIVPGFEGIFNTKWLRHIKAVDQYQLNMNDFGHLQRTAVSAALIYQIGPKSVITFPSGGQKLPDHGWYEITGLAWSGEGAVRKVEISTDDGKTWHVAELKGTPHPMAHTRFGYMWNWDGGEHVILSRTTDEIGQVQPTREEVAKFLGVAYTPQFRPPGNNNTIMQWKIASDGSVTNGLSLRIVPVLLLLASAALAQTYGVGRAPTAAELAQDITISPTGAGLPVGHGTAAEGKVLFTSEELRRLSRPRRRRRGDVGAQFASEARPRG